MMTLGCVLFATSVATAGTPYQVNPAVDVALTAGLLGSYALGEVVKPTLQGGYRCKRLVAAASCDAATLNAWDRTVVGNNSAGWRRISDVGQMGSLAVPVLATALDAGLSDSGTAVADAATETLVITQAAAAATFATMVLKFAVRRPRPQQYVAGATVSTAESSVSFPSGHTTAAAAGSTAYATTFWLKHPAGWARWAVAAAAVSVTAVTGYGRVAGGKHFYTDVVAGALVGGVCGFVLPMVHLEQAPVQVTGSVSAQAAALSLHGSF